MNFKEVRVIILKRDKQCRGNDLCNQRCSKDSIDVHHIIPRSKGGLNTKENCVGLCKRHHAIADNTYYKYGLTRMPKIWLEQNTHKKLFVKFVWIYI